MCLRRAYARGASHSNLDINAVTGPRCRETRAIDRWIALRSLQLRSCLSLFSRFRPGNIPCASGTFRRTLRYATVVNQKRAAEFEYAIRMKSGLRCNSLNGIRGRNFGVPHRDKSSSFSSRQTVNGANSLNASGSYATYVHMGSQMS